MSICGACGAESPERFKFCPECGSPIQTERPVVQERKVVTSLFCDLVGFTAMSEAADPEDVDAVLGRYYAAARSAIEAFGGSVQKFIGDAVVGVFGVPAAHEDDPERAVRAGLRIVEAVEGLTRPGGSPLELRVGINTGEALVRLDVTPGSGEGFLTGDAVNTAARIQSVAPAMGVAVGRTTYEATRPVFDYVELEPATVKGKSDPIEVWQAVAPLARFGTDITRRHESPLVGREIDLALLKGIFDKTVAASSPQLVTIVGEPGLGKSRLVAELLGHVDGLPYPVTWRQGRCLPYGEGITFWAMSEILKAHAGIYDTDSVQVAVGKLDAVLPDTDERAWLRQRLLPLLGIEASSTAEREELFAAWRLFFEHLAEVDPTVVVFEDLHWADPALLAFLEHLGDRAEAVPLLIVGTARPELFEHHPDYADGLRNANTINLAPLSEAETARLLSGLLDVPLLPAELHEPIVDRAGGNPLFAEEFVRLLKDQDLIVANGASWQLRPGAQVPFPDSVQALIAARLDTLTAGTKSLLGDAAVVGKVFWAGAVAAMADRTVDEVREVLRELSRKELVRPSRQSSMSGEVEYAFWHVLTRDVAYNQLPRASRAARHVAAARWIETKAGARLEDLADVLAHHYASAHTLAEAAGDTALATELAGPALRFLTLAGDRALGLDTAAALSAFEQALGLTPPGHLDRAPALVGFADAAFQAARYSTAAEALEEAITLFRQAGDVPAAATAMARETRVLQGLGDPRQWTLAAEAVALLEPLPPGPELVRALTTMASNHYLQGQLETAIATADQALALADQLGLDPPPRAFGCRGGAHARLGDRAGLADYIRAIDLAIAAGQAREAASLHNNYALDRWLFDGPAVALDTLHAGMPYAAPRGLTEQTHGLKTSSLSVLFDTGQHDTALALAGDLATQLEATGHTNDLSEVRAVQTRIHTLRGQPQHGAAWLDWLVTTCRNAGDPQMVVVGFAAAAVALADLDHPDVAATLLAEVHTTPGTRNIYYYPAWLAAMVRTALTINQPDLAEQLLAGVEPRHPYFEHALAAAHAALAEHHRDHATAADRYAAAATGWEQLGVIPEHGYALLGQGRCLLALDRPDESRPTLRHARDMFARMGARPALTETETLLASMS